MHRLALPRGHGMLFVFRQARPVCFWMHDTLVPLSLAFVNAHGIITKVIRMQPLSDTRHCSTLPVRYAIETTQAWFSTHAVMAGSTIRLQWRARGS